jgi:hypothetical protein
MTEAVERDSIVHRYLPDYDVRSAHSIEVDAGAGETYRAARELDLARSLPVTVLLTLRGLPHFLTGKARPTRRVTLDSLLELGFVILEEDPPHAVVLGAVGRFWRPDSELIRIDAADFAGFNQPGYAKAAMSLTVVERGDTSLLATETRVMSTDDAARRSFSLYWRLIGPFSGYIRNVLLQQIKRAAEEG